MYICICQAVTDKEIRIAIQNGATTITDLRRELNVTLDCGKCANHVKKCLKSFNVEGSELN